MDTSSNKFTSAAIEKGDLNEVLAEHLPRLSVLNLYLKFSSPVVDRIVIHVHKNNYISIEPLNLNVRFDGISFENEGVVQPASSNSSVLAFRLVTKPMESSGFGSSQVEFMPTSEIQSNIFEDEGLDRMRKYFLHSSQAIVTEGVGLDVQCKKCLHTLGSNILFNKVRALPAGNWDEKANDLWYCHPPGGSCGSKEHTSVDSVAKSLKSVKIGDDKPATSQSIFDILNNPDPKTCLFSACYWAVNKSVLPGCKVLEASMSYGTRDKLVCGSCNSEVGMRFSKNCYHVWDFGVVWKQSDITVDSSNGSVEERALDNFKRSIFSHIYEISYSPICQFIVKSYFNSNWSLFMWNSDRDLSVYQTLIDSQKRQGSDPTDVTLTQEKVAKFLFVEASETTGGQFNVKNPFEQSLISGIEKDDSLVLFVPDTVLEAGMKYLHQSSGFYTTPPGSFQCGFLNLKTQVF